MKKIFLALLIVVFSLIATGFLGESVRGASNNINNGINFSSQAVSDNLCGNGIVEGNESCDSGANTGNICTPEYNNYCVYCTKSCEFEKIEGPICGDNIVNGPEECDDGNYVNGDGCSSICKIEGQAPYCGDGLVNGNESCDSGFNNGNVCVPDYNNS
ncbi:DUF4215 domain-containing protein, partial [Candidatus Pacearchaeota archaeon]|nr:DUF4215 domain-containing protein [Candidatus Pacearchaeota archaeon]